MPVFSTRSIDAFPIGNLPLAEHHRALKDGLFVEQVGSDSHKKRTSPLFNKHFLEAIHFHPHAWLTGADLASLSAGASALTDALGEVLAWKGEVPDLSAAVVAGDSFLIRHPWDLLRANEQFVSALAEEKILGEVHPLAVIEGTIHLGAGSRILPGVYIEGNVVIGENCKIGPNCYIRGSTSIGDRCHIGQSVEIKNCLILSKTNVGHLSYVGDSVLGEGVNFGAGTTTSNLRHDGKNHRAMVNGTLVDTGRRKFGSIVGDGVHTGIHTSIYPGRQIAAGRTTRPGEIVQHDLS